MRRLRTKHLFSILSPLVGLVLLRASPAHAFTSVTSCGQTLATPGEYLLTTDLSCDGTFANGIVISASDVVFHLAGHTIASSDCDATLGISGISVEGGSGVEIEGGTVRGFNDGIALGATNSHIRGMIVTGACIFGIALSGADNQVSTSTVTQSGMDGIVIVAATGTQIRNNDISDNARVGVDISSFSSGSVVEDNIINRNGIHDGEQGGVAIVNGTDNLIASNALDGNFNGIEVESPDNTIRDNLVSGSVGVGIFVDAVGSPSAVRHNTVLGSALVDMSDESATCAGDAWTTNTFETDLAGGVSDGGPGSGCIQ